VRTDVSEASGLPEADIGVVVVVVHGVLCLTLPLANGESAEWGSSR